MGQSELVRHRLINTLQTLLLLGAMSLLLGYLAWVIGGSALAVSAVALVVMLYWFNPAVSPRMVLKMYRGVPLAPPQAPGLYDILAYLTQRAGLPQVPRLHYVPSNIMNAFSVGDRNEAAIAISDGALRRLTFEEIAGVLAHEIAHISNNDMRVMGFADLASRATSLLSTLGQLLVIANLPLILFNAVSLPWLPVLALVFAGATGVITNP
jgi:heat shock protein HtpX